MKKASWIASALLLGAGASHASAQNYAGSDTLEEFARAVTTACGETPPLTYTAGGSSTGETGLVNNTQQIAPMSRPLGCNKINASSTFVNVANDAVIVLRSALNLATAPATQGLSTVTETLRQVYFGCGPTGDCRSENANPVVRCANTTRAGIVNSWNEVFTEDCSSEVGTPEATKCTQLRHAFRRNDYSGTTDTFRDRLGIATSGGPAAPAVQFCNGNDTFSGQIQADNDPIRRQCNANEQVCGPNFPNTNGFAARTLGVVLSINVPQALQGGSTVADLYPTEACAPNTYRYLPNGNPGATAPCPNGAGNLAGLCLTPVTASGNPNCIASAANPPGSNSAADGRNFNRFLRNADGSVRLTQPTGGAAAARVTSAYWRLHATRAIAPSAQACGASFTIPGSSPARTYDPLNTTLLLGCMVQANGCSIAYAGFDADMGNLTRPLNINGIAPSSDPGAGYPFFRKLFINADDAVTAGSNWDTLRECFRNSRDQAESFGFFRVPGTGILPVESYNAGNCFPTP